MAQKCWFFLSAEGTVVAAGLEENVFAATILWIPRMGMTARSQPRLSLQSSVHTTNSTQCPVFWMRRKSLDGREKSLDGKVQSSLRFHRWVCAVNRFRRISNPTFSRFY